MIQIRFQIKMIPFWIKNDLRKWDKLTFDPEPNQLKFDPGFLKLCCGYLPVKVSEIVEIFLLLFLHYRDVENIEIRQFYEPTC